MNFIKTKIEGLFVLEPKVWEDSRGWFYESFSKREFELNIGKIDFVQDNHSLSKTKGVLRGLHLQNPPFAQSKLVRCIRGSIFDVAVDLRKNSPTYLEWFGIELNDINKKQLFIPHGFAHGFLTLTGDVEINYKVDNFYNKESEVTVIYNDPQINIKWNCDNPILSEKDIKALRLEDCKIL